MTLAHRPPWHFFSMNRFPIFATIAGLLLGSTLKAFSASPPNTDVTELLRQGLFDEEVNNDDAKAAADYSAVIDQYNTGRTMAATAMFRLAEIRIKQGNQPEGIALYQRFLTEFPENDPLAKLCRDRLAALGAGAPGASASPAANAPEAPTQEEEAQLARMRELVQDSPDLLDAVAGANAPMAGYTPLEYASDKGWVQVATFLLDHGAKVDGADGEGKPLHIAVAGGHKTLAELLLSRGAAIDAATPDGWTALHAACYYQRKELASLLLDKGARPNALFQSNPDASGRTEGWGPAVAAENPGYPVEPFPGTPLLMAVKDRDDALAVLLINHGADPNLYANARPGSTDQRSPLLMALGWFGNESAAKLLLDHGAKVDFADNRGFTALDAAVSGAPDLVPMLLDRGLKQAPATDGWTPLMRSIRLLGSRAEFVVSDGRATGPMPRAQFEADFARYKPVWELLISRGADINATDNDGRTALFYIDCALPNSREIYLWMLAHGANINARDNKGITPLHLLCISHRGQLLNEPSRSTIPWMIQHGADPEAKDSQGEIPFELGEFNESIQLDRDFLYPYIIPKLARERAITALVSFKNSSPTRVRIAPVADFDAPPSLPGLLQDAVGNQLKSRLTISIHRAAGGNGEAEAGRVDIDLGAGPVDASKWPALKWGDVVVFESDDQGIETAEQVDGWYAALDASSKRTVTVQLGDRTVALTLANPQWGQGLDIGRRSPSGWVGGLGRRIRYGPTMGMVITDGSDSSKPEPLLPWWTPTLTPLPAWNLSEMVLHLTEAEPRAQIGAIQLERTIDGKTQTWTLDMNGTNSGQAEIGADGEPSKIKLLPAQLADGDRLIIPMLPADNADALAARRNTISFAVPGGTFAEPVFTRKADDPAMHTLAEFLMQAYLDPMVVPNPDLSRIVIHRLSGSGGQEQDIAVNLVPAIESNPGLEDARRADVPLQWGDRVEIPCIDKAPLDLWLGFGPAARNFLDRAVSHAVNVTVDGALKGVNLAPAYIEYVYTPGPVSSPFAGRNPPQPNLFSAMALLQLVNVPQTNLKYFTLHTGNQTRNYSGEAAVTANPWIGAGSSVEIQQIAP